tara:strand:- start:4349 stop:5767 length:1419 start_codon:yes stop_codon:yes gene_type:complete
MADSENTWSSSVINEQLRKRLATHDSAKVTNLNSQPCIAVNMPPGKNLTFDGEAGDNFAGINNGTNIILNGDAGRFAGNGMNLGEIIINGNCDEGVGHCLTGGVIVVQGSSEGNVGPSMKGGDLIISENVRGDLATCMSGGNIIVCGDVLGDIGKMMSGGKIFIAGEFDQNQNLDAKNTSPTDLRVVQKTLKNYGVNPEGLNFKTISGNFKLPNLKNESKKDVTIEESLFLVNAKLSRRPRTLNLDKLEMALSIGKGKEEPLSLTIPLLWTGSNAPSYSTWKINGKSPNNLDSANMAIIDLEATEINRRLDMKRPTDLAFIVELIRQSTSKRIPIMVRLEAGDVENDLNLIAKSGAEGVILVSNEMPIEASITAARPHIGQLIILASCKKLDSKFAAKLLALGASGMFLETECSNSKLKDFGTELSQIVGSLGVGNINNLGTDNLRTNDQNTAAMTGVPIAGYDSVLPMWRH